MYVFMDIKKEKKAGVFIAPLVVVVLETNVEIARRDVEESVGTGNGIGMNCPLASLLIRDLTSCSPRHRCLLLLLSRCMFL